MRNLLKGLILGFIGGIAIGIFLAEQQQRREAKARSEAFDNDPDVIALRNEWRRERQADEWLSEFEGEDE